MLNSKAGIRAYHGGVKLFRRRPKSASSGRLIPHADAGTSAKRNGQTAPEQAASWSGALGGQQDETTYPVLAPALQTDTTEVGELVLEDIKTIPAPSTIPTRQETEVPRAQAYRQARPGSGPSQRYPLKARPSSKQNRFPHAPGRTGRFGRAKQDHWRSQKNPPGRAQTPNKQCQLAKIGGTALVVAVALATLGTLIQVLILNPMGLQYGPWLRFIGTVLLVGHGFAAYICLTAAAQKLLTSEALRTLVWLAALLPTLLAALGSALVLLWVLGDLQLPAHYPEVTRATAGHNQGDVYNRYQVPLGTNTDYYYHQAAGPLYLFESKHSIFVPFAAGLTGSTQRSQSQFGPTAGPKRTVQTRPAAPKPLENDEILGSCDLAKYGSSMAGKQKVAAVSLGGSLGGKQQVGFAYTDAQGRWQRGAPIATGGFYSFACADQRVYFADFAPDAQGLNLYITRDGGQSWAQTKLPVGGIEPDRWYLAAVRPGTGKDAGKITVTLNYPRWAGPSPATEVRFLTDDDGLTWQRM